MKSTTLSILIAAILLPLALTGCKTSPEDVSYRAISRDLSPELRTSHERPIDVDVNMSVSRNLQRRMFWDDLGRVFYTDNPSRLRPGPTIYTSGNPR